MILWPLWTTGPSPIASSLNATLHGIFSKEAEVMIGLLGAASEGTLIWLPLLGLTGALDWGKTGAARGAPFKI